MIKDLLFWLMFLVCCVALFGIYKEQRKLETVCALVQAESGWIDHDSELYELCERKRNDPETRL